jgi:hypothetical protein
VNRAVRLDVLCVALLVSGSALVLWLAPFRSESYYIDWISGAMFGAMVGASESYLTIARFRDRLHDAVLALGCRWAIPEGTGSAATFLALFASGPIFLIAWPGPVAGLTKSPLYLFNTLCGAGWALWTVYLAILLFWLIRRGREAGGPVRLSCIPR